MPIVSVIIPTYNTRQQLLDMVECMRAQTLQNWELIIVDDKSMDGSLEYIKSVITDERIKIVVRDREPKGSVVCRNIGFELASGKYVIHFDADDLISQKCLEDRTKYMEDNEDIDFAIFRGKSFTDPDNKNLFSSNDKSWGIKKGDVIADFLRANYPFSVWNLIFRKKSVLSFLWDEKVKIYTDFSFIIPLLFSNLKYEFADNDSYDYFYRVEPNRNNMCTNFVSEEKCISTLYLFDKTIKILNTSIHNRFYKKKFLGLLELHFSRLLLNANDENIYSFICFVKQNFGYAVWIRFSILEKICRLFKKQNMKKILMYLFEAILFLKMDNIVYNIKKYV